MRCNHLKEIGSNYLLHLKVAVKLSCYSFMAALAFLIHSLLPCVFTHTGSNLINRVLEILEHRK